MKRVNEFGFSAEMLEQKAKEKLANGQSEAQPAIEAGDEPKPATDKKDD